MSRICCLSLVALACGAIGCGREVYIGQRPDSKTVAALREGGGEVAVEDVGEQLGASGEGWGSLKGRFVLSGDAPPPLKVTPTKDVETCAQFPLFDESLVVGDGGGLKNVYVYLRRPRGVEVPIHESYNELPAEVVFDNLNCRFEPHAVAFWYEKQKLLIKNSDPIAHNTNIGTRTNAAYNNIIPAKGSDSPNFTTAERSPVGAVCNVHPWMAGLVFPTDSPYFAISEEDGSFTIENVPAGRWEFQVWHESAGDLEVNNWRKGRFTMDIAAGENDLAEIEVPLNLLQSAE